MYAFTAIILLYNSGMGKPGYGSLFSQSCSSSPLPASFLNKETIEFINNTVIYTFVKTYENKSQYLLAKVQSTLPLPPLSGLAKNGNIGKIYYQKTYLALKNQRWYWRGGGQRRSGIGGTTVQKNFECLSVQITKITTDHALGMLSNS